MRVQICEKALLLKTTTNGFFLVMILRANNYLMRRLTTVLNINRQDSHAWSAESVLPSVPHERKTGMNNLQEKSSLRNCRIAVSVILMLCLLAVSFPFSQQSIALANSGSISLSRLTIDDKVVERRSVSGEVTSRIHVKAANRNGFQFRIEDYEAGKPTSVIGTGKVEKNSLQVEFNDLKARTVLNLRMDVDPSLPGLLNNTITLDERLYRFDLDLHRAREKVEEMQRLLKEGKKDEAFRMKSQITATLSPKHEYLAFFKDTADSPAASSLGKAAKFLMMLNQDETDGNTALAALRSTAVLLIPFTLNVVDIKQSTLAPIEFRSNTIAVSYERKVLTTSAKGVPAAQTGVHVSCGVCSAVVLGGGTISCLALGAYGCDPTWPDWLCVSVTLACIGGVVYLFVVCEEHCE